MLFTEGKHRVYERIMQEKPCYDRHPAKTMEERDCKHCMYYDKRLGKCSEGKCIVYDS